MGQVVGVGVGDGCGGPGGGDGVGVGVGDAVGEGVGEGVTEGVTLGFTVGLCGPIGLIIGLNAIIARTTTAMSARIKAGDFRVNAVVVCYLDHLGLDAHVVEHLGNEFH